MPSARSKDSADLLAEDEDALRAAAWRWRFNRRWAQEQARQMDPDYGRQVSTHPPPFACSPHVTDAQQIDVTSFRAQHIAWLTLSSSHAVASHSWYEHRMLQVSMYWCCCKQAGVRPHGRPHRCMLTGSLPVCAGWR